MELGDPLNKCYCIKCESDLALLHYLCRFEGSTKNSVRSQPLLGIAIYIFYLIVSSSHRV